MIENLLPQAPPPSLVPADKHRLPAQESQLVSGPPLRSAISSEVGSTAIQITESTLGMLSADTSFLQVVLGVGVEGNSPTAVAGTELLTFTTEVGFSPVAFTSRVVSAPEYLSGVKQLLTDREQRVISGILDTIEEVSRRTYIRVQKIVVDRFVDAEDGSSEVVLGLHVPVPMDTAFDYWARVGVAIEQWSQTLPKPYAEIAIERIAIEVQSTVDGR